MITAKYGIDSSGQFPRTLRGLYGMGSWKRMHMGKEAFGKWIRWRASSGEGEFLEDEWMLGLSTCNSLVVLPLLNTRTFQLGTHIYSPLELIFGVVELIKNLNE